MNNQTSTLSQQEIAEIDQHKYFMSERAGYDVGWEVAELDWREHVAAKNNATFSGDDAGQSTSKSTPRAKGLGGFIKRLISKAAV